MATVVTMFFLEMVGEGTPPNSLREERAWDGDLRPRLPLVEKEVVETVVLMVDLEETLLVIFCYTEAWNREVEIGWMQGVGCGWLRVV
mmetsp:Transcript_5738/g.13043  ORF Transcript_5738/g.13043 Transcript_5738/m.13043 type:complete len:88 (+) Transcript_5738:2794-3057(+)